MAGQVVGYVRVSSFDQNPERQYDSLGNVERVFEDRVSGKSRAERVELARMIEYVRDGDTVRVASMDRLARSLRDLQTIVGELVAKGVTVEFVDKRLTFAPGATDAFATFQLQLLGAVAELERSLIRERQAEGIALAKERGVYKGRAPKLSAEQVADARQRVADGVPKAKVARDLDVSRQTLYAALAVADKVSEYVAQT